MVRRYSGGSVTFDHECDNNPCLLHETIRRAIADVDHAFASLWGWDGWVDFVTFHDPTLARRCSAVVRHSRMYIIDNACNSVDWLIDDSEQGSFGRLSFREVANLLGTDPVSLRSKIVGGLVERCGPKFFGELSDYLDDETDQLAA